MTAEIDLVHLTLSRYEIQLSEMNLKIEQLNKRVSKLQEMLIMVKDTRGEI